jgi:glycosyltransferase involved in cell wall biosynthesis
MFNRLKRLFRLRVGWVTYDSAGKANFAELGSFTRIRAGNIGEWLNRNERRFWNELYNPRSRYDVVVFQKMFDGPSQAEARRLRDAGTRVVFDINVNYYEVEGDYFVPGTRPTDRQQADCIRMTQTADWVVADSSHIAGIATRYNPRCTLIPDNVDLDVYRPAGSRPSTPDPLAAPRCVLVWCGVAKKAAHLALIREALAGLTGVELLLVAEEVPAIMSELQQVIPCRYLEFSDAAYADALRASDIIISPKRLCNAYEMGHTEYKITLGMACGLPAVASPQPSYVEAIGFLGGGIIARTSGEWQDGLTRLARDPALRVQMGAKARQTVVERYGTPVVARQYGDLLSRILGMG